MEQLTPSLSALLGLFSPCFRPEVFSLFRQMVGAWIVCLGRRTISRVWETTGRSQRHSHCPAFRLFSAAAWNWDEVGRLLLVQLLAAFVPGSRLWVVVDDTLCHKRGANVTFGGVFRDAVLSTKKHKVFRFGTNWVTLGLVVQLPFRPDRFFCLNVLWRVYAKKGPKQKKKHKIKSQLALEMVQQVAGWLPGRQLLVVADSAYMSKHLLKALPANACALGPIHWKAKLTRPLPEGHQGRRKVGDELTTPREALADERWPWGETVLRYPGGEKPLRVKVLGPCCWYRSAGQAPLRVVLVRDPEGSWRDEAFGAVGRGSDRGLRAALERGGGLLREQATAGLSRADGVQRGQRRAGAPDGVVHRQPGGAVVRPRGQAQAPGRAPPAVVQEQGRADDGGHAVVLPAASVVRLAAGGAADAAGEARLAAGIHRHGGLSCRFSPPGGRQGRRAWVSSRPPCASIQAPSVG